MLARGAFIVPRLQCCFYTGDEMEAAPSGKAMNGVHTVLTLYVLLLLIFFFFVYEDFDSENGIQRSRIKPISDWNVSM